MRTAATAVAAALLFAVVPVFGPVAGQEGIAQKDKDPGGGTPLVIEARPIGSFQPGAPDRVRFGPLAFRGGLVLTSKNPRFGGLSGLVMRDAEHFVAISDRGTWFSGRIVYRGDRPAGIADATTATMRGPDGRPLDARGWFDTESLTADGDHLFVGIERVNRIVRYDLGQDGLLARGVPIAVPNGVRQLPFNKGLEGLAFVPPGLPLAGTLIALSERGLDGDGNVVAFLIGGKTPGSFAVRRRDDFDISDATILPTGDLLLLERRFTWTTGVASRLRRIPLAAIAPGALVDGEILLTADMGFEIDNLEAIGVHRDAYGALVLTLVSDDNFSVIQRTLLLQFTLIDE
ncbi:hypothetical protein A33M_3974 [Rhodovulum sp. PH10]|uniref:esterase-like activity of phytase family protein n=1 Tax=Rhodovulum sp. PH10 TaxID=1187851 RepID=UPI00027C23AE|nr:esterase-like activity of phytase family protein [Rhodovulum sp. PH10]EJW10905.1 hypothetical protein A33M_3974 [Rhodovulum sp. PH10]